VLVDHERGPAVALEDRRQDGRELGIVVDRVLDRGAGLRGPLLDSPGGINVEASQAVDPPPALLIADAIHSRRMRSHNFTVLLKQCPEWPQC
jgi:hypothetical protein